MKKFFLAIVLTILATSVAYSQNIDIKTHTLKNGMKILVHEDNSIPNAAMYIFYRIGSRNERPGTTGLSHFFEHMMFNGAKKYGPGEFDRVMESNGGTNNAYTNRNLTVYQDWFPSSQLELIFDLEADRIENLSIDPKIVESERGVVYSERRNSVDSNNLSILDEQLWASAFVAHPYQWPVVGWPSDIEKWSLEDLRKHFEAGYSPSNATMVVTGNVQFSEVIKLAEKYIEPIKPHNPPATITTVEPEQLGERRIKVEKAAQVPAIAIGYHVSATNNPEFYPIRVLETVLFSGESSRLYKRLVDKDQTVLSIGGGIDFDIDPTLFTFYGQIQPGTSSDLVEKAIYEELEKVKTSGITEEELKKAKNILLFGFYSQLRTIAGKANTIGTYEVYFGDYKKLLSAPDDFAKVTNEDVKRIAQKYFTSRNRSVVTLVPIQETEQQSSENKQ
ncbi:MAG: insulinase family protein [Acidobacteria bacterium]|nr:insulinase family protein [Acidobacteriota bacterium]